MPIRMCDGLQLEEFCAEGAEVDVEGSGGGRAAGECFREEFVVCLWGWV
jgi:hypothetical protein